MTPEEMLAEIRRLMAESDRPDSMEFGTPAKGGTLKVYFSAARPDEAAKLIEAAMQKFSEARKRFAEVA